MDERTAKGGTVGLGTRFSVSRVLRTAETADEGLNAI